MHVYSGKDEAMSPYGYYQAVEELTHVMLM